MRRIIYAAGCNPHLWIVVYLLYVGVDSLLHLQTPRVMEHSLPSWLTTAWMCALTAGGVLALGGCIAARTRVESAGLVLQTFGISLYCAVVAYTTSISPSGYASVVALVAVCASRMWVLSLARRARRQARHVQEAA